MIKVFIYLNDIDIENGPFHYIPKTHDRGAYGKVYRRYPITGRYVPENKLMKKIDRSSVKVCTGKKGTVILCDTSGFHKGGYITKPNCYRFLHNAMFTSALANHPLRIRKVERNFLPPKHSENPFVLS